jgi:DNA mismatch repair ATPase MutL
MFEDLYRQYNAAGQLMIVLNMIVADGCYDINVSPDKREVFLQDEA